MKFTLNILRLFFLVAILSGLIGFVFTAVTLGILAGGWLVNWMFPGIPYEFASIVAGQGLLMAGLVLALAANFAGKVLASQELQEQNSDDDDIEEDDDNTEAAGWLAERIAVITHAQLKQTAPKTRRYTAKPRQK